MYAALGLSYAYLGRHDDAVRLGNRSISLYPVSRDAFEGPRYVINMARVYSVVGEPERALDLLEELFVIPSGNNISIPLLLLDPIWDPLRQHPRFQRLVERGRTLKEN